MDWDFKKVANISTCRRIKLPCWGRPSCYLLEVLLSLSWRSSTAFPLCLPHPGCGVFTDQWKVGFVSFWRCAYVFRKQLMYGWNYYECVKQQQVPCYCVWVKRVLSVSWAVPRWLPSVAAPVCWADDGDSASGCVSFPPRCFSQRLGSLQQDLAAPIPSRVDHRGCCSKTSQTCHIMGWWYLVPSTHTLFKKCAICAFYLGTNQTF